MSPSFRFTRITLAVAVLLTTALACDSQANTCANSICGNSKGPIAVPADHLPDGSIPSSGATTLLGATTTPPITPPTSEASAPAPTAIRPTKIPLTQLCNTSGAQCSAYTGDITIPVGSKVFASTLHNECCAEPPNWDYAVNFPLNTCRSLVVNFAQQYSGSTNLRLIQTHAKETRASAAPGTIGTLSVKLDGGPFILQTNASNGTWVYMDGYAVCNTASGLSAESG